MEEEKLNIDLSSYSGSCYVLYATFNSPEFYVRSVNYLRNAFEVLMLSDQLRKIGYVIENVFVGLTPIGFNDWHYPKPLVNPEPSMN